MEKVTNEQLAQKIDKLATKEELSDLARSIAENFVTKEEFTKEFGALRKDMQNGFSLIMEELKPMRRDYGALKDDVVPQLTDHGTRIAKLEQKVA